MLASHLIVPVEWRTPSCLLRHNNGRPSSSRQLCVQHHSSIVPCTRASPTRMKEDSASAHHPAGLAFSHPAVKQCRAAHNSWLNSVSAHHAILSYSNAAVRVQNGGPTPTRTEKDIASAHNLAVLAILSYISAAVLRRAYGRAPQVPLSTSQQCSPFSLPAVQQCDAMLNGGPIHWCLYPPPSSSAVLAIGSPSSAAVLCLACITACPPHSAVFAILSHNSQAVPRRSFT